MSEVLKKMTGTLASGGKFAGYIEKEKGEDFILDTSDGRVYSFVISRAKRHDGEIQRQLELEYAGYVPGFDKDAYEDEEKIVRGMVDLAKYILLLHNQIPLEKKWTMSVSPTQERKYDFVRGADAPSSTGLDFGKHLEMLTHPAEEYDSGVERFRRLDLSSSAEPVEKNPRFNNFNIEAQ